jgi:hypothetical protein
LPGVAIKVTLLPAQIGPLGEAAMLIVGVTEALITTEGVDADAEQPAALVTVTVYVPAAAKVTFEIEGF